MKALLLGLISIVIFSCVKCGHLDWQERKNVKVQLYGEILNYKDTYKLGDTLKFYVEIPDSVEIINNVKNTSEIVFVQKVEHVGICSFLFQVIDTLNKSISSTNSKEAADLVSVYGNTPNGCYAFKTDKKPFHCLIYLIPKIKGFYKLSTAAANSNIKINGNKEAITGIRLNVPDKRLKLLSKWMAILFPQNTEQEYYNAYLDREVQGGGTYSFFVE